MGHLPLLQLVPQVVPLPPLTHVRPLAMRARRMGTGCVLARAGMRGGASSPGLSPSRRSLCPVRCVH